MWGLMATWQDNCWLNARGCACSSMQDTKTWGRLTCSGAGQRMSQCQTATPEHDTDRCKSAMHSAQLNSCCTLLKTLCASANIEHELDLPALMDLLLPPGIIRRRVPQRPVQMLATLRRGRFDRVLANAPASRSSDASTQSVCSPGATLWRRSPRDTCAKRHISI